VFGALSAADLAQSADTLESLYPSHDAFVTRFAAAADALVRDLYWLKPEADEAKRAAEQSHVGR